MEFTEGGGGQLGLGRVAVPWESHRYRGLLTCNQRIPPISMYAMYDIESLRGGQERDTFSYEICMIDGCTWYLWQKTNSSPGWEPCTDVGIGN